MRYFLSNYPGTRSGSEAAWRGEELGKGGGSVAWGLPTRAVEAAVARGEQGAVEIFLERRCERFHGPSEASGEGPGGRCPVLEFRLFRVSWITPFLPHGRSISHARSLANWDGSGTSIPISLFRQYLRRRCGSLPVPDPFFLAVASLRPSARQALQENVQYNTRNGHRLAELGHPSAAPGPVRSGGWGVSEQRKGDHLKCLGESGRLR